MKLVLRKFDVDHANCQLVRTAEDRVTVPEGFRVDISRPKGGQIYVDVVPVKKFYERLCPAFLEFNERLLGEGIDPKTATVLRKDYTRILSQIEKKYKIEQGDPDMGLWTMTLVMSSPKFADKGRVYSERTGKT